MYVYYGTNEYNFEKLANPPAFEPTQCTACKKVIKLGEDGYSQMRDGYYCMRCTNKRMQTQATHGAHADGVETST